MSDLDIASVIAEARTNGCPQKLLDIIPYSDFIGATAEIHNGKLVLMLAPRPSNIGNPSLPAIHGGVVAGFLELTATMELLYTLNMDHFPKVIDFSLDYLRPARYKTTYASCRVLREGNRLINASIIAWQEDVELPVATARCHFLIRN